SINKTSYISSHFASVNLTGVERLEQKHPLSVNKHYTSFKFTTHWLIL
ncbi:20995_t:CDS:1, partial [Gigaspora rosea]